MTDWPKVEEFNDEPRVVAVEILFTTCDNTVGVLPENCEFPPYDAVMEWVPAVKEAVIYVACPLAFNVPVPSVVVPSLKVTVPVGVPAPGGFTLTVAVNVTDWPKTDGLTEEATVVVVGAWVTVNVKFCVAFDPMPLEAVKVME